MNLVSEVIQNTYPDLNLQDVSFVVEKPKNPKYGHFATNCVLTLTKLIKKSPNIIAEDLIPKIKHKYISEVNYINNFLNFRLHAEFYNDIVKYINLTKEAYGFDQNFDKKKVNLEFVSTNPTGPLHIGHTRGAIIGNNLATLLSKVGFEVTKEYLVNDYGSQIVVLAKSVIYKALDSIFEINLIKPKELYPGQYLNTSALKIAGLYRESLIDLVTQLKATDSKLEMHDEMFSNHLNNSLKQYKYFDDISKIVVKDMMSIIKEDLNLLDIKHDVFFSEREMVERGEVNETISLLEDNNLIKILDLQSISSQELADVQSQSSQELADVQSQSDDEITNNIVKNSDTTQTNKPNNALVFRSDLYGDDKPRVVKKANGELTYFASDLGYINNKIHRNFDQLIYLVGFDHIGYIARIKAGATAMNEILIKQNPGHSSVECIIKIYQMVNYLDNGEPVRMSKRSGKFDTVRDVLDAICYENNETFGKNVLKFMMLSAKDETTINFDIKKAVEKSHDNVFYYIQYAYARINSILKNLQIQNAASYEMVCSLKFDVKLLSNNQEEAIIIQLGLWPYVVQQAVINLDLSRIVRYLEDLARMIHGLWNFSTDGVAYKIITQDVDLSACRVGILLTTKIVMENATKVLNIQLADSLDKIFSS